MLNAARRLLNDPRPFTPESRPIYYRGRMVTLGHFRRGVLAVAGVVALFVGSVTAHALYVRFSTPPPPSCIHDQGLGLIPQEQCVEDASNWCVSYGGGETEVGACLVRLYGYDPSAG